MDVVRTRSSKKAGWWLVTAIVGAILIGATFSIRSNVWRPRWDTSATPVIDREGLWTDEVKRGHLVHSVRGTGTLIPQNVLWLPAVTPGRVAKINVMPGDRVQPDTCILTLSNQELEYSVSMATAEVRAAEQKLEALSARLKCDALDMEAELVDVQAKYDTALIELEVNQKASTAVPRIKIKLLKVTAESLERVVEVQTRRLVAFRATMDSQLAAQRAEVEVAQTKLALEINKRDGLRIAAGMEGILEQVPVEVGQRIESGEVLAKVIDPQDLKATLRVSESQGRYVAIGQPVDLDTHHGTVPAIVTRIDPAVQNGNVLVEAEILSQLPKEARPDLSVVGTIQIERLEQVLHVGRPVIIAEQGSTTLFRVADGGSHATRTAVHVGPGSPSHIQVIEGLAAGDVVILSDMSRWDAFDRVELQ